VTTDPPDHRDSARDASLRRALAGAELAWAEAVGGGSVCRVDAGTGHPVKRLEGAVFALAGARRRLDAAMPPVAAVRTALDDWRQRIRPAGGLWEAYAQGGESALTGLLSELEDEGEGIR
jgi:hypothetical protein